MPRPPIAVAVSFIDAINRGNVDDLGELMEQTLIWLADIEGDKVAKWTLVTDTPERRRRFGLPQ